MPPVTTELIENESHLIETSSLGKRIDESLLSPPAILRGKRKQRNGKESNGDEDPALTSDKGHKGGTVSMINKMISSSDDAEKEIPLAESRDDGSASVASLSLIGKMMSRPDVEVTNLSNGDYVDDTIVLSSSVLEALNGMDEDETILPDGNDSIAVSSEVDGTVISTIKSVAASILQTAKGKAPTQGQEQNFNRKEDGGTAKNKTPVKYMTFAACVLKTTRETKTGLSINRKNGKKMKVTEITEGGLFDSAGLKVGDEVLCVNNVATEGRSPRDISTLIRETPGTVTVVARRKIKEERGAPPQDFVTASVLKTNKKTKTGISIKQVNGEDMIVTKLAEGGLFDSAGLKVGDAVLFVNNVATEGRSPREISTMIRDMVGTVAIVARRKEESGAFPQGVGLNHASSKERSPRRNRKQSRREPVVRFDGVFPPQETRNYKSYGKVDRKLVENDTFSHHELLSVDEVSGMTSLSSGSMMRMTEFLANDAFCCQMHADCYFLLCGVGDEGDSVC